MIKCIVNILINDNIYSIYYYKSNVFKYFYTFYIL